MKRTILAVALAVVFVMAIAAPVFAQMSHSAVYEMDGVIDFKKQAGHLCNTGAQYRQTIYGAGEMFKEQTVYMVPGLLSLEDDNDFVAGETSLEVTSTIELCAPPKYTYDDENDDTAVVHPSAMYGQLDTPYVYSGTGFGNPDSDDLDTATNQNVDMNATAGDWEAVSKQIWAVQVSADPGYSGNLYQDFTAAYGPYEAGGLGVDSGDDDFEPSDDYWGWANDDAASAVVGDDYVGNYFTIDQHARTSMGEVKRYIDISSPFTHAYLMEDMSIVGKSDILEAFDMTNIGSGAEVVGLWWDLF